MSQVSLQKHLGLTLDNRLTFDRHLKNVLNKISKTIGLFKKIQNILPRPALLTINKCLMRPYVGCNHVIYDQSYIIYNLSVQKN